MTREWIGVDLDGTLAHYTHWDGSIGGPIPAMVERVKAWIADGQDVRIFTARVARCGEYSAASDRWDDEEFRKEQEKLIMKWCSKHIGHILPVTATKDFLMKEYWDDRAVQVIENTGEPLLDIAKRLYLTLKLAAPYVNPDLLLEFQEKFNKT